MTQEVCVQKVRATFETLCLILLADFITPMIGSEVREEDCEDRRVHELRIKEQRIMEHSARKTGVTQRRVATHNAAQKSRGR